MPPQEEYNDYHDGDTDEEIMTEAAPEPIIVLKDDEDPEEVIPEGEEEEQAPGDVQGDHHEQVEEDGGQEQADQQGPVEDEPAEEVMWKVEYCNMDGIDIPMADSLRAMVHRLGYDKAPVYRCELWTHPWFEPR
jgi:hypothetical protein